MNFTATKPLAYSVFASVSNLRTVDVKSAMWAELVESIKRPKTYRSKTACPLLKLASFGDRPNEKGSLRHDDNVELIYGVEGDYDANEIAPAEGARRLRAAGLQAVIYTSATHGVVCKKNPNGGPRWRVLAPLSAPVAPSLRHELVSLLNGALGGILAGESWTLSQTYYFGRVEGVEYEAIEVEGYPLDVVDLVRDFEPIEPAKKARAAHVPATPRRLEDADSKEVAHLVAGGWLTGGHRTDGAVNVRCPREMMHTSDTGPSSTTYFPAGVGGCAAGGFDCKHTSCGPPSTTEFRPVTGLDDVLSDFEVIVITSAEAAESAAAAIRNAQKAANEKPRVKLADFYAYAPDHKYIYRPTRAMWPAASVDGMVSPWPMIRAGDGKEKPLSPSRWLDRHAAVQQMTWLPGAAEVIADRIMLPSGWSPQLGARVYNRYLPPAAHVGSADLAGPWVEHLTRVYPDDMQHLLRWFAHRVQRPGEKVNHAVVLGGCQGIGKDSILVPLKVGVGPSNVEDISPTALMGGFNSFAACVLLVVSEARNLGEHDRFELYEQSKTYICAPPEVLRVNEKHLREYYVPNLCGVVFTTNHRTSGLYLPADDRRHFVAWSEASREQFADGYFRELHRWYEAGGIGHVLAYLHNFDLSGFDPKAEPPKTAAFWSMVQAGESPEASELRGLIDAMGAPDALTLSALAESAAAAGLYDLSTELRDRKNRARVPHMLDRVDYTSVHNPDNKRGRFGQETVYAKKELSFALQVRAARAVLAQPPGAGAQRLRVSAGRTESADFPLHPQSRARAG